MAPSSQASRHQLNSGDTSSSLRTTMGVPALMFFGLSYMVPMTIFTTYGIVNEITRGFLASAYIITFITMLFTACSYAFMGRAVRSAGSAYGYTRVGLGGGIGFVTGWAVMIDYILMPMLNYLVIGLYLTERFPSIPAWVFSITALVLVTGLNIVGVTALKSANAILVILQITFFAVFFVYAARAFDPSVHPLDPFIRADIDMTAITAGAAVLCLSFLGFDAVSTMSEEAVNAKYAIPRAVILTAVIGGLFFIVVAWFAHMAVPEVVEGNTADTAAFALLSQIGGNFLSAFFLASYVTGVLGSALTSQASVSRILYAMGRDGLIPRRIFGTLNQKFKTPVGAILVVAAISVSAAFADLDFIASIVSFGGLTAFSMVNLSVISFYLIRANHRTFKTYIYYGLIPGIGFCLTIWLWTGLAPHTVVLGLFWVALGVLRLLWHTRMFTRPVPKMHLVD